METTFVLRLDDVDVSDLEVPAFRTDKWAYMCSGVSTAFCSCFKLCRKINL